MFNNREEAGYLLAEKLRSQHYAKASHIAAIPRGGVVVGRVVANLLELPLVSIVVKKIGSPGNPELAIGAVGPEGTVFWDEKLLATLQLTEEEKKMLVEKTEQERKEREVRLGVIPPELEDKTVVVVDDGVATGSTACCTALFLKKKNAKRVILATPVIARDTLALVKRYYTKLIYHNAPSQFYAVGEFYKEFPQVSDEEVARLLKE